MFWLNVDFNKFDSLSRYRSSAIHLRNVVAYLLLVKNWLI